MWFKRTINKYKEYIQATFTGPYPHSLIQVLHQTRSHLGSFDEVNHNDAEDYDDDNDYGSDDGEGDYDNDERDDDDDDDKDRVVRWRRNLISRSGSLPIDYRGKHFHHHHHRKYISTKRFPKNYVLCRP